MNPLPDRIAAAIDAYGQDRAHDGDCASRDALIALFAELVSERDRAVAERDAVARHRDELLAICRRDSDAAHDAVLSGREHKFKFGAMLVRDAIAELVQQRAAAVAELAATKAKLEALLDASKLVVNTKPRGTGAPAVTAQRDELLRAAVKVLNTSPRVSSSRLYELDHMDACTDLGVTVERIARAQPEQPSCHLCHLPMPDGTDGHGLGECVPVCPTCEGSGIEQPEQPPQPKE